jgi:hypothetical protein
MPRRPSSSEQVNARRVRRCNYPSEREEILVAGGPHLRTRPVVPQ